MQKKYVVLLSAASLVIIGGAVAAALLLQPADVVPSAEANSVNTPYNAVSDADAAALPSSSLPSAAQDTSDIAPVSVTEGEVSNYEASDYFIARYKYPFSTYREGVALTDQQVNENMEELEKQYQDYLKTCKSDELRAIAEERYNTAMQTLQEIVQIKARTPEEQQHIHEVAFMNAIIIR